MTTRLRSAALAFLAILLCLSQPRAVSSQASSHLERLSVKADDGHALTVWAKHPQHRTRGAILLLHGRTWSALPNFDLHVDGESASLMDALTERGYAVYALNPHAIHVPIMLLNGERDPNVINSSDAEFFAHLASVDRRWVVLANSDHVARLGRPKDFVYAMTVFLGRPVTR